MPCNHGSRTRDIINLDLFLLVSEDTQSIANLTVPLFKVLRRIINISNGFLSLIFHIFFLIGLHLGSALHKISTGTNTDLRSNSDTNPSLANIVLYQFVAFEGIDFEMTWTSETDWNSRHASLSKKRESERVFEVCRNMIVSIQITDGDGAIPSPLLMWLGST
jgi:hypothetical protein